MFNLLAPIFLSFQFIITSSIHSHFLKVIFLDVVGVRPQDDKVLENGSLRDELFSGQFSSLALTNKYGSIVGLEPSNLLGLTCLTNSIDGNTDAYLGLDGLHIFVDSQKHARVDRECEVVEEVMVFSTDEGLHISGGV